MLLVVVTMSSDGAQEACGRPDDSFLGVFDPDDLSYRHVYFLASTAPSGRAALRFETTNIGEKGVRIAMHGSYAYPQGRFATATLSATLFSDANCPVGAQIGSMHQRVLQNSSADTIILAPPLPVPSECNHVYSGRVRILVDNGKRWVALSPDGGSDCFAFRLCCSASCDTQPHGLCTSRAHCEELDHQMAAGAGCPDVNAVCCLTQSEGNPPSSDEPSDSDSSALGVYVAFSMAALLLIGIGLYYMERRKHQTTDEFGMHIL